MFTSEEKRIIRKILDLTPQQLDDQIAAMDTDLTAELEADARAELDSWAEVGGGFASFEATESNQGFVLNADDAKNAIRAALANIFGRRDWFNSSSAGTGDCGSVNVPVEYIW